MNFMLPCIDIVSFFITVTIFTFSSTILYNPLLNSYLRIVHFCQCNLFHVCDNSIICQITFCQILSPLRIRIFAYYLKYRHIMSRYDESHQTLQAIVCYLVVITSPAQYSLDSMFSLFLQLCPMDYQFFLSLCTTLTAIKLKW